MGPAQSTLAAARHLFAEIARELRTVPEGQRAAAVLTERARRAVGLRAQDLRGWPLRRVRARALRAELDALIPWPADDDERVLLSDHAARVVDAPTVSVVIPVYGKLEYTLRCLVSITRCHESTPLEIIVVDDCSPDATERALSRCPGIRYVRNETNVGFIDTSNRGATLARGRYVHFLNNDTVVLPGWLDRLVETLEQVPEAGLVGSRLIYPDLSLQEAGGIVWRDASATNWGNGRDPFNPTYGYLRDVDYASAASVLLPAALFREVGGFDPRYRPAYYEDTDLAFKIRAAGRRVLYQPASRVIHHEGATAGTDVTVGPKKHQVTNRETFRAKWQASLSSHGHYGETGPAELDRFSRRSVLVLDSSTPRPDESSGAVDQWNLLRVLRSLRCRVTFLPVVRLPPQVAMPDVLGPDGRYTEALEREGVECLYAPYEPSVARLLRERGRDFDVVILTRARVADRFLDDVRRHCPRAKVVFNTTDLSFLREEREARHRGSRLLELKARDTRRRELRAVRASDVTIVLSTVEAEILAKEVPGARVRILPLIREVPGRSAPLAGREGVLFVGGFRHRPNVDAVEFLVGDVWPRVRRLRPGLALHIAGSATPPDIYAMAADDVTVHGFVPDLSAMLARVRLTVAPLRFGAGLKGKVAESLGHGVPCVATAVAVEGSGLRDGEEVLVADAPEAIAAAILRLHDDAALWERLSLAGVEHARRAYSIDAITRRVAAIFTELGIDA